MLRRVQQRFIGALRWSEKYTKTDMVYLAHGGLFSAFAQGVGLITSLAFAVAVSHFVPKETYGIYKYTLSIVTLLSLFSLNSIGDAVFQSAAQGFDGSLLKGFRENIRWSVAVFGGALLLSTYYFVMGNSVLAAGILIGGSLSPFLASASLFGSFLGGKKDFTRRTLYGILDTSVPIIMLIGVVMLTSNPVVLISAYFVTNTLAALFFYRRTVQVYHAQMHAHDEDLVSYSKHLSFMGVISGIATNIDQILLFHFVGAAQLAVYNFATAIPDTVKGPVKNIDAMMQARFVGHSDAEIKRSMGNKLLWYLVFGVAVTVVYIMVAPYIFHTLFPNYSEAIWYSQLYMLWVIPVAFDPLSSYLYAKKLVFEQYVSNIVYSVFQIGALLVGVIFWGLLGVIVARISTRVVVSCVNYFLYRSAIRREATAV